MIVICLEGPHGSGKTSLCKEIAERGLNVMDEAFFTMVSCAAQRDERTSGAWDVRVCVSRCAQARVACRVDALADVFFFVFFFCFRFRALFCFWLTRRTARARRATQPKFALHPQSLVMETLWVTHWVQRLLEKQKALKNATGKNTVFFADRSPYSAVFYAKTGGQLLRPVIAAMIAELANNNIHIFTVHIKVCVLLSFQF